MYRKNIVPVESYTTVKVDLFINKAVKLLKSLVSMIQSISSGNETWFSKF